MRYGIRLDPAEDAAINRASPPAIAAGVSDADIQAFAARVFRAGREYQRRRTSRLTREEAEALADVYRAEAGVPIVAGIVSRISSVVRDELTEIVRLNDDLASSQRDALQRMLDRDLGS